MYSEIEFNSLIYLFFRLVQSETGRDIVTGMEWKNDAQVLAVKIFRHITSVNQLSFGATCEIEGEEPFKFIDHSSINIVTRAALESYLTFNYIYINENEGLSIFRHKTWQLGGLIDRSQLLVNTPEAKIKLEREASEIAGLKSEISVSEFFLNQALPDRKKILAGRWRPQSGWKEMAQHAGIHKVYFENVYNHLSGHSHASFISAMQIRDAEDPHLQKDMADAMKQICCVIMAHFCFSYIELFKNAEEILKFDKVLYDVADKWYIQTEDMNEMYGVH